MSSLQGHLLIASPKLGDQNFFRSVVLLVRHNEEGAFGLVLNRPSNTPLAEIWPTVSDEACAVEGPIYHGGPCPGPLLALHRDAALAEAEALPEVFITTSKEQLEKIAGRAELESRFFVGYAGWSGGQLESELEAGGWFSTPGEGPHVFWPDDALWEEVCRDVASTTKLAGIKVKNPPPDVTLN